MYHVETAQTGEVLGDFEYLLLAYEYVQNLCEEFGEDDALDYEIKDDNGNRWTGSLEMLDSAED